MMAMNNVLRGYIKVGRDNYLGFCFLTNDGRGVS